MLLKNVFSFIRHLAQRWVVEKSVRKEIASFAAYHFYLENFSIIHSEEFVSKALQTCELHDPNDKHQFVIDALLSLVHQVCVCTTANPKTTRNLI